MDDKNNKKSVAYHLGYALGVIFWLCAASCVGAAIIAIAIKIINWLLFIFLK